MNKKSISTILLIVFIAGIALTAANSLLSENDTSENQTGTLTINNETVHYEKMGKCIDVIDANTIHVYSVGKVQLDQIHIPDSSSHQAKKFVEEKILGKNVYLDIDDKQPEDKYGRTLAIVYSENEDINRELIENDLAEISYFEPSEFEKGEI